MGFTVIKDSRGYTQDCVVILEHDSLAAEDQTAVNLYEIDATTKRPPRVTKATFSDGVRQSQEEHLPVVPIDHRTRTTTAISAIDFHTTSGHLSWRPTLNDVSHTPDDQVRVTRH
jgi:hypothetical protein